LNSNPGTLCARRRKRRRIIGKSAGP
jgi:hypothetical protein